MPIYEFKCEKCETTVEKLQTYITAPPTCCGESMQKQINFPAMVKWKGSGGYPSNIKMGRGTAPFTSGYKKPQPSWKLEA